MSVGHSRRTSRSPSGSAGVRQQLLQLALDALLLERGGLAHVVRHVRHHLGDADLEPVLGALLRTTISPSSSSMTVGGVIQFCGLKPPVSACDHHRAVRLEHEQPQRLGQHRGRAVPCNEPRSLATIKRTGST